MKGENSMIEREPCCGSNSEMQCDCRKPVGYKTPKVIVSLVVFLAVVSIVAFKMINTSSNAALNDSTAFNFGITPSETASFTGNTIPAYQNLGEYLETLGDLNTVAFNKDAVFVYIPASGNALIDETSKTNIIKFQEDLQGSNVAAGLYTLSSNTPEYMEIAKQVKLPVVFVARKGASAITIPGNNVNEYMLFQAYQACCDTSLDCCP
jgi:hypothetical protein